MAKAVRGANRVRWQMWAERDVLEAWRTRCAERGVSVTAATMDLIRDRLAQEQRALLEEGRAWRTVTGTRAHGGRGADMAAYGMGALPDVADP